MEWEKAEKSLNRLVVTQVLDDTGKANIPKVKYTIPGPMTLVDVLSDKFYGENNTRQLIEDLICCLNKVRKCLFYFTLDLIKILHKVIK